MLQPINCLLIALRQEAALLDEFVITGRPEVVHGSPLHHVYDYTFLPEDKLLLVVYEKNLKTATLLLTDQFQETLGVG